MSNHFNTRTPFKVGSQTYNFFSLRALEKTGLTKFARLPFSIRILLENLLRTEDARSVRTEDIEALARWNPSEKSGQEIAFTPARVILQDFTGVPVVVDLAAMRDAIQKMGGDAKRINPL